ETRALSSISRSQVQVLLSPERTILSCAPGHRLACRLKNGGDLLVLTVIADEICGQARPTQEFSESLMLAFFPIRMVEVFIKDDDRAGAQPRRQQFEHGPRGGIEIAINMEKANCAGVLRQKGRQAFVKPAFHQRYVGPHRGQIL